jgi:hypothetical protein
MTACRLLGYSTRVLLVLGGADKLFAGERLHLDISYPYLKSSHLPAGPNLNTR